MRYETDGLNTELLWHRFAVEKDASARTALIEGYSSLTQVIAASLYARRSGDDIAFEEYVQFGMIGLIESIDRYKTEKCVPFEAYAKHRIRGAILNGLKKMSERREQYAFRERLRKERLDSIADGYGPKDGACLFEEMVEVALGMAICYMLEGTGLIRDITNPSVDNAYQAQELSQLRERLIESSKTLPVRERSIIQQHYFRRKSFASLSKAMGISKGRVSQLHKRALNMLRKHLADSQSLDGYY
ncbi:MAG: sigma-70 family RNA polymerase sigma factor [Desulfobacteraceae bacterium]|jgi:RNA polymerase sigma factor for flagellar operon FliA